LQAVVEGEKLNAYLAIQFLRCIVDSLERQFLDSGSYADKREELTEARAKLIHQFLILDQGVLRLVSFLAHAFLALQGVGVEQEREEWIKRIVRAIACELPALSDGLFY
jgi:hypothetical protein